MSALKLYDTVQEQKSKIITLEGLERRLSRIQTRFENNPTDEDKTDIDLIKQDIDVILKDQVNGC